MAFEMRLSKVIKGGEHIYLPFLFFFCSSPQWEGNSAILVFCWAVLPRGRNFWLLMNVFCARHSQTENLKVWENSFYTWYSQTGGTDAAGWKISQGSFPWELWLVCFLWSNLPVVLGSPLSSPSIPFSSLPAHTQPFQYPQCSPLAHGGPLCPRHGGHQAEPAETERTSAHCYLQSQPVLFKATSWSSDHVNSCPTYPVSDNTQVFFQPYLFKYSLVYNEPYNGLGWDSTRIKALHILRDLVGGMTSLRKHQRVSLFPCSQGPFAEAVGVRQGDPSEEASSPRVRVIAVLKACCNVTVQSSCEGFRKA